MAEPVRPQRRFLIDDSAVETRLAELVHGRLVSLKLFARVAPGLDRPQVGDVYVGRVAKAARGMNAAFVDLGEGGEAILRLHRTLPEGTLVLVRVTRAAYGSKLPVVSRQVGSENADLEMELGKKRAPRRVRRAPGALVTALRRARTGEPILVDGDDVLREARLMGERAPGVEPAPLGLFEREGVEAQIEAALEPMVALASGGRLVIEETQALTAIDVDVAGALRAADVNMEAAQELAYQIAARRLAGMLVVDFAQIKRAADLGPLKARLQSTADEIGLDLKLGAAGRTGLLELQRARGDAPLAAVLTAAGVTHGSVPLAWSAEAEAARLARAIRATSARVAGALSVRVGLRLGEWLTRGDGRPAWEAIVQSSAARLHLRISADLGAQAFAIERSESHTTTISRA